MNDYYFYRYKFVNIKTESTLPLDYGDELKGTPRDLLDSIFNKKRKLPIHLSKSNGEEEVYDNNIYSHDGVGLMQLQNNILVRVYKDFQGENVESHPYLNVVIDNREGHQLIGIEKNSAFRKRKGDDNSTQGVATLIGESVSAYLAPVGIAMQIKAVARPGELWPTVLHRITHENKRVKSITFSFPSDNDLPKQKQSALETMIGFVAGTGASGGALTMNYAHGDETEMTKAHRSYEAMRQFIGRQQQYEISARFEDMTLTSHNTMVYSHKEILERDISDFIAGSPGLGGTMLLCDQLTEIHESLVKQGL